MINYSHRKPIFIIVTQNVCNCGSRRYTALPPANTGSINLIITTVVMKKQLLLDEKKLQTTRAKFGIPTKSHWRKILFVFVICADTRNSRKWDSLGGKKVEKTALHCL